MYSLTAGTCPENESTTAHRCQVVRSGDIEILAATAATANVYEHSQCENVARKSGLWSRQNAVPNVEICGLKPLKSAGTTKSVACSHATLVAMPQHAAKKRAARPPPGGRRVSAAEVLRRLDHADKLLREGTPRAEVVESMTRMFGVSTRAADSYIAKARERWADQSKDVREVERGVTLARLDCLSGKAEHRGAFAAAVSAEKLKAQVNGLLAPQAIEVKATLTNGTPSADESLSDQQIAEELASIGWVLASMFERGEVQVTPSLVESVRGLIKDVRTLGQHVGLLPAAAPVPALARGV